MTQKIKIIRQKLANPFNLMKLEAHNFATMEDSTRVKFQDWVSGMIAERDGETGCDRRVGGKTIPGFWSWIVEQNRDPAFLTSDVFRTFVWTDATTRDVVATGTIAPDDRGVKKEYRLGGTGIWGGINVRHDLRGRGIGSYICQKLEHHVFLHDRARDAGDNQRIVFHLFTDNPVAERIYARLGFERNPMGIVHTAAFGDEVLMSKCW